MKKNIFVCYLSRFIYIRKWKKLLTMILAAAGFMPDKLLLSTDPVIFL